MARAATAREPKACVAPQDIEPVAKGVLHLPILSVVAVPVLVLQSLSEYY